MIEKEYRQINDIHKKLRKLQIILIDYKKVKGRYLLLTSAMN